jgi:hypothetical protein
MRGMAIVGPHGMPGLPSQSSIADFNALGNNLFEQKRYREAIEEYNRALGVLHHKFN